MLGGVGLLLSGVLMGTMQEPASATTSTLPVERANQSIALVKADGGGTAATGLVLDDDGHVLVDGRALRGADDVWVRCADGDMQPASIMARDERTDLAVLQLDHPHGVPASISEHTPAPGADLQVVQAGDVADTSVAVSAQGAASGRVGELIDLAVAPAPRTFLAAVGNDPRPAASLAGGMVFDRSGRLAGVVTDGHGSGAASTVRILRAADAVDVADELLARDR